MSARLTFKSTVNDAASCRYCLLHICAAAEKLKNWICLLFFMLYLWSCFLQHKYYSNPIDAVFFLFFAMLYHLAIRYYVGSLSLSYLPKTCLNAKKNEQSFIGQEGITHVTSAIVIARWAKITFRHESKLSFINSRVTELVASSTFSNLTNLSTCFNVEEKLPI